MKGILILVGMIAVAVVMCGIIPFVIMPNAGVGVALPVIKVPGEVLWEDFLDVSGLTVTNTIVGTLVADVLVLLFAFGAVRNLKTVPGRLQGLFEILTDALWGLAKTTAGKNARPIFPLMATIFLFLLVANWVKLVPGAESIGLMHCADEGVNGYERDGALLVVDKPMDTGVRATEENYDLCHHPPEDDSLLVVAQNAVIAAAEAELDTSISWADDVENGNTLVAFITEHVREQHQDEAVADDTITAEVNTIVAAVSDAALAEVSASFEGEDAHPEGEEAEGEDADADHPEGEDAEGEDAEAVAHADEGEGGDDAHHGPATPDEAVRMALEEPHYLANLYAVTPFVRGATTDLNLTLALGLLAFLAIQYFGVKALGIGYFTKFFNTPALENIPKNPMGLMDFVVGLLEIISELAKILSFGFRLFGNLFAGGVLLFVMSFLVAMLVPAGVYALELFVGLIQAFVFAMLLLVFSSMAMEGHDHGDEHH